MDWEYMSKWFNGVLANCMEMIVVCDAKGKILDCNPRAEAEIGFSKEDIRGLSVTKIFENLAEKVDGKLDFSKWETDQKIVTVYRKNKTCFPATVRYSWTETPMPLFVIFGLNYSDYEEVMKNLGKEKEKVESAQKVRNEFVSNVTHELRTPINGIKGHIQILAESDLATDQKERVSIIRQACENMEQLVNGILDYSKLEAGKFLLEKREFNFPEFIKYVEEVNRVSIESKGLEFYVHLDDRIPETVVGDSLRVTQVLNNLLSNAKKFTATGQVALEISLTNLTEDKAEIFFMVMDTGIGIAEKDMDKLFKDFSQVDASIARQYGGTGLGLAISKRLVELMGGTIRVESQYGKGTTFSFSIIVGLEMKKEEITEGTDMIVTVEPQSVAEPEKPKLQIAESKIEESEGPEFQFGSDVNKENVCKNLEKMVLCLDMERFGKAEEFLDNVKNLLKNAPEEVQKQLFRVSMNVRKENYEKSIVQHDKLRGVLEELWGGGMRPWK